MDETFSFEEKELLEVLSDPVKFAQHHFGWEAYPYQAEALRDMYYRKVLRWGRRTGKSDMLAVFVLWFAFTHGEDPDDPKVRPSVCLVATPYESQVKLIFKRIRELIAKSPELQQSIAVNRKNPEYIEFKNKATIAGFTAGTKSGAGAGNMRGQYADWIIVDEMDYMTDDDITAIFAIASDKNRPKYLPPIGLMISSTPNGRRGKFYEFCMDAQDNILEVPPGRYHGTGRSAMWTEYYYPSLANPGWMDMTEDEREQEIYQWKVTLGEAGYVHEILAEFGVEAVGVFNKSHIDRSKRDYQYIEKAIEGPVRVIGVDWDKIQATPTLCCLEWCPDEENESGQKGMFKVINRISIPAEEFTLDAGVRKVVEWNMIYQPEWIYVDRGAGEYQVEMLHKMGKDAGSNPHDPAYLLHKRVKGIHFGESREIRDPGTGEMVKKPIKPWMVTQTVILLERDRLVLNKNDDEMWKQMENYRVEKVSVDGRPTYTSVNEHSVDALMLCALAIAEQLPDHIKFVQKYEPTRKMTVAPPIVAPVIPITRGPRDINVDDAYAKASRARGQYQYTTKGEHPKDYQTWFRVDDIRDTNKNRNVDQTTVNLFTNSPFVPRGTQRRHNSRGSF